MANVLNPTVCGRIGIGFGAEALLHKTREERNEYLAAIREKISVILEEFRCSSDMINHWFIELYEHEENECV